MNWLAEKYTNLGGNSSRSLRNSLGRPSLEPLEIMIREAVQNSWDAKIPNTKNINFNLSVNKFSNSQLSNIREIISRGPSNIPNHENLSKLGDTYILLQDSNTEGLTGPTRAIQAKDGEPSDYIDFILKSGEERDKEFGGGTYGFGKSSLHRVSKISTIFVFTKTQFANKITSRLIAYTLGNHDKKFTGRFWYGNKIDDTTIDPLIDDEAIKVAKNLGFNDTDTEKTGTTILIPFPETGSAQSYDKDTVRTAYECFIFMLSSIYWNLWPKFINFSDEKNPPIKFRAFYMGDEYPLFHPNEHPMLSNFIEAYYHFNELNKDETKAKNKKNILVEIIKHRTFKLKLGILSTMGHSEIDKSINGKDQFQKDLFKSIYDNSPTNTDNEIKSHHIALMRSTELIIKYYEGPLNPEKNYSGVFITSRIAEVDKAFSDSEPPTHDNWSVEQLFNKQKKIVIHAFTQIKQKINEMIDVDSPQIDEQSSFETILDLSYLFGNMLAPMSTGVAPTRTLKRNNISNISKTNSRIGFVKILKNHEIKFENNSKIILVSFIPNFSSSKGEYILSSKINTCVDVGSSEQIAPKNELAPEFLYWISDSDQKFDNDRCKINSSSSGKVWKIAVKSPPNTSISVNIDLDHG